MYYMEKYANFLYRKYNSTKTEQHRQYNSIERKQQRWDHPQMLRTLSTAINANRQQITDHPASADKY